jgi:small subunit ribosomal protein S4
MVYRMGFSSSRKQARQLVRQNHFTVNGRKVNIPSFQVSTGDVIEVKDKSKKLKVVLDSLETVVRRGIPAWVELDKDKLRGTLTAIPNREDLTMPMQEQLIVELYSK